MLRDERLVQRKFRLQLLHRTLTPHETKYSAMVLDVGQIGPTDRLMAGVDQAQRTDSEQWWRTDLRAIAEKAFAPPSG